MYDCPVYATPARSSTHLVFHAPLKSLASPAKWVLAGAALVLD